MGANLGQGRFCFGERAAREHELFLVAARDHLQADRQTVGARADRDAHRGHARDVERRGERNRAHAADALPGDLHRRRALGHERGRGGGRREDEVDLVEHVGDRPQQLPTALLREQQLVGRQPLDHLEAGPRHRRHVVRRCPRARSRWFAATSMFDRMLHARPGRGKWKSTSTSSMPASSAQRERGFVRELLDLGIAHREAERRRPRGAQAAQARRPPRPTRPLPRTNGRLRQRGGVDVGRARRSRRRSGPRRAPTGRSARAPT